MPEYPRPSGPLTALWDWQYEGACIDMDSSFFFHPDGERGRPRRQRDDEAKAVCRRCPVLLRCREYALTAHEPYGVWGGMTEEERRDTLSASEQ